MISELPAFVAVSIVVICTPGPDTILTVRNTVLGGRIGGAWTAVGVATGQLAWTVAASLGVASLLRASQPAFLALKFVGVGYLLYLGVQSLRSALCTPGRSDDVPRPAVPLGRWRAYRQGLVNNLANPKMAAFFLSLLPQFVSARSGHIGALVAFLLLGLLFCLMTFGWLYAYSVIVAGGRKLLDRPRFRHTIDTVAGCALIAFGVRLALADRNQ